jgi:hypothetical protein
VLLRILVAQGNSERLVVIDVARLPLAGEVIDLPDGGSCTISHTDQIPGHPSVNVGASAIATLDR